MQKAKSISGEKKGMRLVDYFILLLFILATVILVYLFIDSLQTSRVIKEELNTKTSVKQ
jgi:hypothetical protein